MQTRESEFSKFLGKRSSRFVTILLPNEKKYVTSGKAILEEKKLSTSRINVIDSRSLLRLYRPLENASSLGFPMFLQLNEENLFFILRCAYCKSHRANKNSINKSLLNKSTKIRTGATLSASKDFNACFLRARLALLSC